PNADANPSAKRKPKRLTAEELEAQEEQKRHAEEKKRADAAAEVLKPLAERVASLAAGPSEKGDTLRKDLREFLMKHSATPAATKACELLGQVLAKLPSPLDALDPKKLPQDCLDAWRAAGREPPGELVGVLGEHRRRHWSGIRAIACSPDGKWIASADQSAVRIWDAKDGREATTIATHVQAIAFRNDSKVLATAHNSVILWDVPAGKQREAIVGQSGYAVAFSPDGRFLATATRQGEVVVRDAKDGKELDTLPTGEPSVFALAFSRDSQVLAAGASKNERPGKLILWHVASRKKQLTIEVDRAALSLDFDPTGKTLACGGAGVTLWDVATGKKLAQPVPETHGQIDALAFVADGKTLAVPCIDGKIYLWTPGQEKLRILSGQNGQVRGIALLPRTQTIVSGGEDGAIRLWDVATGKELQPLAGPVGAMRSLAFTPDCEKLVSAGPGVCVWEMKTGRLLKTMMRNDGKPYHVFALAPDGRHAVTGEGYEGIRLWDVENGSELLRL
ncbi:MAG: WD40 repeat domain-containing protein, partial [Planctomycetes bacterium]|nr:WD40 repeat domain-containing protein [Planctomycetota bacterium]